MPDVETELRRYIEATVERVRPVTADEARERARRRRWFAPGPRMLMLAAALAGLLGVAGLLAAAPWNDGTRVATDAPSAQPLTLDGHRDWLISLFDGNGNPSDAEIESRFSAAFLDEVPPAEVRATGASVANNGSGWMVLRELDRREDTAAAIQLVASNGEQALLSLSLDDDGRVTSTTIRHAVPCAAPTDPDTASLAGPLADRLQWYLDVINSDRAVTDEEINSVFAPAFVDKVRPDEFRSVTAEVRTDAPLKVRFFEGSPTPQSLVARLGTNIGREVQVTISLEAEAPWRISGLAIRPNPQPCRLSTD